MIICLFVNDSLIIIHSFIKLFSYSIIIIKKGGTLIFY